MHAAHCGSVFGACSFAPFPPKSRACVQYQYLDRSMRHATNVCAPDFAVIFLSRPAGPAAAIIESSSLGSWVLYPTAQIERIYQNEKVEKLQNNLAKVKIIVNWSMRKRKTFENNYSQGKSRMGMPLRYIICYSTLTYPT